MNKLIGLFLAMIVTVGMGCKIYPTNDDNIRIRELQGNVVYPGQEYLFGPVFAAALECDASQITYSIQESVDPGFQSPRDGVVTQQGVYTAPSCGSPFIGAVQHVIGRGCGKTGIAAMAATQEVVDSIAIAYAVINPETPGACLAPDPLNITVAPGTVIQFYSKLVLTCSEVVSPPPPAGWPPVCP